MRNYFKALCAGLIAVGTFSGCSDDNFGEGQKNIPSAGTAVNFTLSEETSRTVYDDLDEYQINWSDQDKVRIFCNEAEDVKQADYNVIKSIDPEKENEGTLQYNEQGLAWGSEDVHNFYAVYPADNNKVSVENGIATFGINLNQVCTLPADPDDNGNYEGTPDMSNAYMVANLSTTPVDEVPLTFKPIMTTLKVTVRARETVNTSEVTLTGISIINRNVRSSDAGSGKFQYDIAKGSIVNSGTAQSHTETTFVRVRQGNNYHVDLQPGQSVTLTVFLPPLPINADNQVTLRVHATGETTQEVTLGGSIGDTGQNFDVAASAKAKLTLPYYPSEEDVNGNIWMTPLDDNIYVSQLSIPGTHDSATRECDLSSGKCQSATIAEQLEMGIRCFDLRPAAPMAFVDDDEDLPIYHGAADCHIDLKEVYETFNTFLDTHPGEFIIAIVRWEEERLGVLNAKRRFDIAMNSFIGTQTYTKHALPAELRKKDLTLGEARGHILSIMRPDQGTDPDAYFANEAPDGMMFISGFPGSHAEGTKQAYLKKEYVHYTDQWASRTDWIVYCQNYYEVNNEETEDLCITAKINAVKTYLDYSKEEAAKGSHVWVINHCSGYLGGLSIGRAYARLGQEVNLPIYDFLLDENRTPGSTGIVLLDYVGDRVFTDDGRYTVYGDLLPQTIIDNNYKYRMLRKTN